MVFVGISSPYGSLLHNNIAIRMVSYIFQKVCCVDNCFRLIFFLLYDLMDGMSAFWVEMLCGLISYIYTWIVTQAV